MADMAARALEHVTDTTLTATMKGYINPLFLTIVFFTCWILIFMKGGGGVAGRGGGWCRTFMLAACFSQSLIGWFDSFTPQQQTTIPLMVFPMIGFIAFHSNHPQWLVAYASRETTTRYTISTLHPVCVFSCCACPNTLVPISF